MVTAPQSSSSSSPPAASGRGARRAPRPAGWRLWLLLGVCFGLGYGITERLVSLDGGDGRPASQSFGVKAFPGTPLGTLRQRFGAENQQIRGDLDLLELERQRQRDQEEIKRRQEGLESTQDSTLESGASLSPADQALPAEPEPLPALSPEDVPQETPAQTESGADPTRPR
ncbi:MAG: hypothetical protein VKI83_05035 [Synechococcaceae cyanobacterium]|nr:hypothetical protein [Synechococcaceae cyanobacterium]